MGVDAQILIRGVKEDIVTEEWLTTMSWRLADSVGAKKFFIRDGLPENEYTIAYDAWSKAFDEHPLYPALESLRTQPRSNAQEIHERIIADIGKCPEELRRAIRKSQAYDYSDDDERRLPDGSQYDQDGDSIMARPGECLLEVSLWTRYYGIGYERGDLLGICAICEWIETNIPGAEVWYGGDSSSCVAEPFPESKRYALRQHMYSPHGRDYFKGGNPFIRDELDDKLPPACGLCPGGKYCGSRHGWGGNTYAAYSCSGCGSRVETHDGAQTWQARKDK